jgi:hypothetical protein
MPTGKVHGSHTRCKYGRTTLMGHMIILLSGTPEYLVYEYDVRPQYHVVCTLVPGVLQSAHWLLRYQNYSSTPSTKQCSCNMHWIVDDGNIRAGRRSNYFRSIPGWRNTGYPGMTIVATKNCWQQEKFEERIKSPTQFAYKLSNLVYLQKFTYGVSNLLCRQKNYFRRIKCALRPQNCSRKIKFGLSAKNCSQN